MYKVKSGKGKGAGIIPFPTGSVFAAVLIGFEIATTRDGRDNKKLATAITEFNGGESDALDGFDESLFYERAVLQTGAGTTLKTIDLGFPVGQPVALKVVRRDYVDGAGNTVEGKALAFASDEDLTTASGQTQVSTWAAEQMKSLLPQ